MVNIKDIYREIKDTIYNDETLSLPYAVKYFGKMQLGFFVFECEYLDDEKMQVNQLNRLIYVDLNNGTVNVDDKLSNFKLPILIKSDISIKVDEIEDMYNNYYKSLQCYFESGKGEISKVKEAFDRIVPSDLVKVYAQLGAIFSE